MYAIHSAFQIVTMSSLIKQGEKYHQEFCSRSDRTAGTVALSILSAIHVAVIVLLFWILLANALVATQVVE